MRDLKLLDYAGGKLHFSNISTAGSIELIRKAKLEGYNVTCDVAAHQIAFDDSFLKGFDTNYKVNPPFRSQKDIEAIWKGLKDGTIDIITSSHSPHDEESKKLEFDLADFGVIGLETAFSVVNTFNKLLTLEELVQKFAVNPRKVLGRKGPSIREGELANITVFDTELDWIYTEKDIKSKSRNSPFVNFAFKGKAIGVFNNGKQFIGESLNSRVNR
jgi:dihydroorotase